MVKTGEYARCSHPERPSAEAPCPACLAVATVDAPDEARGANRVVATELVAEPPMPEAAAAAVGCPGHPQASLLLRCVRCREAYCPLCLERGVCAGCLATGSRPASARVPAREAVSARPIVLAGVVVVLAGILIGRIGWELAGPPASARACSQRLEQVVEAAMTLRGQLRRVPDGDAVERFIRAQGAVPPPIVPGVSAGPPNAVLYEPTERGFELRATDARGHLFEQEGRVVVITGS